MMTMDVDNLPFLDHKMQRNVFVILLLCIRLRCTVLGNQQTECHRQKTHRVYRRVRGVGDGNTLNTKAFHDAISYLCSSADQGGSQLYIPPGIWLTGSFNLTSHFTLFIDKDGTILGSQNSRDWPVIEEVER
ncbi:hypothetical protein KP509_37G027800 [Ceratopteris richardii]|uniref:Polygalacturonase n=1 Tax=Ceratopteris richardii TaxID=49495 RepID=A0A8T2Q7M8_CERRI|nr:hypothetical protein KP509_37G027800 [Ceratopteris richardii]